MDKIFFCSSLEQLKKELLDNGMIDSDGNYTHGNKLSKIIKNDKGESVSLVHNNKLNLSKFPSLQDLGTYDEMFNNPDSLALYKRCRDYNIPITSLDENGVTIERYLPKKICEFA